MRWVYFTTDYLSPRPFERHEARAFLGLPNSFPTRQLAEKMIRLIIMDVYAQPAVQQPSKTHAENKKIQ